MNVVAEDKVKGMLITKTAIKVLQSEDTVEKIINFQFKDGNNQVRTAHQIEFSGLGKMMISKGKVKDRIKKMENSIIKFNREILDPNIKPSKLEVRKKQIIQCEEALTFLKEKNQRYEN